MQFQIVCTIVKKWRYLKIYISVTDLDVTMISTNTVCNIGAHTKRLLDKMPPRKNVSIHKYVVFIGVEDRFDEPEPQNFTRAGAGVARLMYTVGM
jgi:hypothetical protein